MNNFKSLHLGKIEKWISLNEKDLLSILARQEGVRKFGSKQGYSASTFQIFLSYANPDQLKVSELYDFLSAEGFKPWMDKRDMLPGEKWEHAIKKAIQQSNFFIACISRNSVNRRGFLQKEIRLALDILDEMLDDDIYLIPARLEECSVPEALSKLQWVDLFKNDSYKKIVEAIYEGVKRRRKLFSKEGQNG